MGLRILVGRWKTIEGPVAHYTQIYHGVFHLLVLLCTRFIVLFSCEIEIAIDDFG